MVGKLFKYEAKYYLRLFIPIEMIVLVTALFMRTLYAFQNDSIIYNIIFGSVQFLFGISICVSFGAMIALAITRFFKNLYSSEGYLSFVLPVTASQHIQAKLFAALVFLFFSLVAAFCGFTIATAGELFIEYVKAAVYILKELVREDAVQTFLLLIELLLLIPATLIFELMLFYTCISLGQLAKKARVFMAFLYYFIYYNVTQILLTVAVAIIVGGMSTGSYMEVVITYIENNFDWLIHVFLWVSILFSLGISALFFVINKNIMTNKLNLE